MARSERAQWRSIYERLFDDPAELGATPCPHCGTVGSLHLVYVVRPTDPSSVMAHLWCDVCRTGMVPLRAPVPPHGPLVARGEEDIPDYQLAVDDDDDED